LKIEIINLQHRFPVSRPKLTAWTRRLARAAGLGEVRISLALMDDPQIECLHRRYLKKDGPTDVLAFSPSPPPSPLRQRRPPAGRAGIRLWRKRGEGEKTRPLSPRRRRGLPAGQAGKGEGGFLGDIVVSVQTAKRAASKFGNPWDVEVLLYIAHGLLHLTGYRDSTPRQKSRMEARQEKILRKVLGKKWQFGKQKPLF